VVVDRVVAEAIGRVERCHIQSGDSEEVQCGVLGVAEVRRTSVSNSLCKVLYSFASRSFLLSNRASPQAGFSRSDRHCGLLDGAEQNLIGSALSQSS
jgi:hypothetical protein